MNSQPGVRLVAIVDDDPSVQRAIKDLMESSGLPASCFGSAEEFLGSAQRSQTGALVADIMMPGMSGLELQARLKGEGSRIPIVFITASEDLPTRIQAMNEGAVGFLPKPFDDEVLLETVWAALRGQEPGPDAGKGER